MPQFGYFFCAVLAFAQAASAQTFTARVAFDLAGTFYPDQIEYAIWEDGTVVLEAIRIAGDLGGFYREGGPGGFTTIIEENQAAPGLPGRTLLTGLGGEWTSRQNGSFVQALTTTDTADNRTAAWLCQAQCELVFLDGDPFPGLTDVQFDFGAIAPRVGGPGKIAFYATLSGSGVTPGTGRAFVAGPVDDLRIIARERDPAPGRPGEQFAGSMFNTVQLSFNRADNLAFLGSTAAGNGVWSGPVGAIEKRAFEFEPILGTGFTHREIRATSIQSDHRVMVFGRQDRVFTNIGGSARLAAQTGAVVNGEQTGTLVGPTVNGFGSIAYIAQGNRVDLLIADQPAPRGLSSIIAKTGTQAPGLAAGVEFSAFPNDPVINQSQQVAFDAIVTGPGISTQNDHTLWIHDPVGGLVQIAHEGQPLLLGPGDTRTLERFATYLASHQTAETRSIENGGNLAFNDRGELVYHATFTNGSKAVVVGSVFPAIFRQDFEPVQ